MDLDPEVPAHDVQVPVAELCRRFGISRQTGYVWLRRYRVEGEAGLVDRSRRPRSHPWSTSEVMVEVVCAVRRAHPAWGGRKIRGFLLRQGHNIKNRLKY